MKDMDDDEENDLCLPASDAWQSTEAAENCDVSLDQFEPENCQRKVDAHEGILNILCAHVPLFESEHSMSMRLDGYIFVVFHEYIGTQRACRRCSRTCET